MNTFDFIEISEEIHFFVFVAVFLGLAEFLGGIVPKYPKVAAKSY